MDGISKSSPAATVIDMIVAACAPGQPRFQGLGILPGQEHSTAKDVSNDGSVVVGASGRGHSVVAYRWTANEGMVSLGAMPGETQSSAEGVSADGSVIVGFTPSSPTGQTFKWTAETGFVGLGGNSPILDVSSDGSVIAGAHYIWYEATGRVPLPISSGHNGLTPDGRVVAGFVEPNRTPARWTAATGVQLLGDLPGGMLGGLASGVSADGSVIVGFSGSSNSNDEAFRWTADGGMIALGDLAGGDFRSLAIDVTADGSTIVGWGISELGEEAFYWQEGSGMRPLREVLVNDYGLDLSGWMLNHATAISADGSFIVGNGTNPAAMREAWIAVIPEPATFMLTVIGATLLGCGALLQTRNAGKKRRLASATELAGVGSDSRPRSYAH